MHSRPSYKHNPGNNRRNATHGRLSAGMNGRARGFGKGLDRPPGQGHLNGPSAVDVLRVVQCAVDMRGGLHAVKEPHPVGVDISSLSFLFVISYPHCTFFLGKYGIGPF